ncbi:MAG: 50S ribosomal protein L31e [Candidatus Thermoplasmatota archaeon]|nr:50S ribosomal protein L31e [Candidatus Thermoplasmatota archaeon]MBS3789942.1 50S ribosomal protein L31e [Candidatus Thermoplasmatota archaeon]
MVDTEERIMNIPLREAKETPSSKRASRAMKLIREFVSNNMNVPKEDVWIDSSTNEAIWERGIKKPPSKIKVKAIKFEDGIVEVSIPRE